MKYLKSINELLKISDDEFDDIKDVFQDLADEFDLEETIYDVPPGPGIYYKFDNHESIEDRFVFRLDVSNLVDFERFSVNPSPGQLDNDYMLLFILVEEHIDKFKLLYNKLSDFKNRLRNMGYLVEYVNSVDDALREVLEFNDFAIRISLIS